MGWGVEGVLLHNSSSVILGCWSLQDKIVVEIRSVESHEKRLLWRALWLNVPRSLLIGGSCSLIDVADWCEAIRDEI